MKIAFTKAAKGERYLIEKKSARDILRASDPELPLLAFQSRHGPRMTEGVAYCAMHEATCVRILSVAEELVTDAMVIEFSRVVLPWVARRVVGFRARNFLWPQVIALLGGVFVEVSCGRGGLFPNLEEIRKSSIKVTPSL